MSPLEKVKGKDFRVKGQIMWRIFEHQDSGRHDRLSFFLLCNQFVILNFDDPIVVYFVKDGIYGGRRGINGIMKDRSTSIMKEIV